MSQIIEAFPLQWPDGWKRAQNRSHSRFKTTFGVARDALMLEIRRMGGTQAVLSTNIPIRLDGLPYSGSKPPQDPGVAVYFNLKGKPVCFACDRWKNVTDNVQALRMTIEALRGIERWSASDMMERAFRGFTALPAPEGMGPITWRAVLKVPPDCMSLESAKLARNIAARLYHPDFGTEPDTDRMAIINDAFARAEKELS